MNNNWLKLALISFVGMVVSLIMLYFVQIINPTNLADQTAMNHGAMNMTSNTDPHSAHNAQQDQGQGSMQNYPVANNYQQNNAYPNAAYWQNYYNLMWQLNTMKQQLHYLRHQYKVNNSGTNNSGNSSSMSMPMM